MSDYGNLDKLYGEYIEPYIEDTENDQSLIDEGKVMVDPNNSNSLSSKPYIPVKSFGDDGNRKE